MQTMLAVIAPGQGSQTPGMLNSWIEDAESKSLLRSWSDAIELDLLALGTTADADEIKDTANAQPLIVAAGLLSARALRIENYSVTAGHSVGELTVAALSGAISHEDALRLVRARGSEMAKAAAQQPSGMAAVLGGERSDVISALGGLGLIAANENGGGQIVAAGDLSSLAALGENPPTGSRVRALTVAGAFHTSYMASAVEPLRALAATIATHAPRIQVISNKDGEVVADGALILDRIINQIANPVRWDLCMERLNTLGVTGVIELAPAGTLVGLLKRGAP
ncbi:MAG: ACP S-malonyltransferase, partial [Actinobacteria bacterium]|nr:ACP S-malonyltransferase [Actinomycetota bacterium]